MARVLTVTLNPALDLTAQLPALRLGEVNRSDNLQAHAAGKGLNVAQVTGSRPSADRDRLSRRSQCAAFRAAVRRAGFADEFVRVAGETHSNIKLAEADGRITDINGRGWRSAPPSATSC